MQKLFGVLIMVSSGIGLYLTLVGQGLSWYTTESNDSYINSTTSRGWIEDETAWWDHYRLLQRNRDIGSIDADVFWQLGEMHRLRTEGLRLWPDKQREEQYSAKKNYLLAITLSPGNGELLSQVAQRLAYMSDQKAIPLMRRSLEIAPYEVLVQYQVADVGFMYWDRLDPTLKSSFRRMLIDAIGRSRIGGYLKAVARRHGRSKIIAPLFQERQ